jgi:hypothetical protein
MDNWFIFYPPPEDSWTAFLQSLLAMEYIRRDNALTSYFLSLIEEDEIPEDEQLFDELRYRAHCYNNIIIYYQIDCGVLGPMTWASDMDPDLIVE